MFADGFSGRGRARGRGIRAVAAYARPHVAVKAVGVPTIGIQVPATTIPTDTVPVAYKQAGSDAIRSTMTTNPVAARMMMQRVFGRGRL